MQEDLTQEMAFSHLMEACFRINRQLVIATGELTRDSCVTGAQWGVLGAFAGPDNPLTVADAARRLGLARQGVQRVADLLEKKGLIEYRKNPHHRRAKLAKVTDEGWAVLKLLSERQARWAKHSSGALDIEQVEAAAEMVRSITNRLLEQSVQ